MLAIHAAFYFDIYIITVPAVPMYVNILTTEMLELLLCLQISSLSTWSLHINNKCMFCALCIVLENSENKC